MISQKHAMELRFGGPLALRGREGQQSGKIAHWGLFLSVHYQLLKQTKEPGSLSEFWMKAVPLHWTLTLKEV